MTVANPSYEMKHSPTGGLIKTRTHQVTQFSACEKRREGIERCGYVSGSVMGLRGSGKSEGNDGE